MPQRARHALLIGLAAGWVATLGVGLERDQSADQPTDRQAAHQAAADPTLVEGLGVLEPFVGYAWEIDAQWLGGEVVQARNEYRALMGGRFVEAVTRAASTDGAIYQRYRTIFGVDDETGHITAYTFSFDGSVAVEPVEIGVNVEGGEHPPLRSGWVQDAGGQRVEVRQEVQMADDALSYTWRVHMGAPGGVTFQPMMDGVWRRGERLVD